MKTKSTFVRSQSAVETDTVARVDVDLSRVISPWDSEYERSFRLNDSFQYSLITVADIVFYNAADGKEHFMDGLKKLFFPWEFIFQYLPLID